MLKNGLHNTNLHVKYHYTCIFHHLLTQFIAIVKQTLQATLHWSPHLIVPYFTIKNDKFINNFPFQN